MLTLIKISNNSWNKSLFPSLHAACSWHMFWISSCPWENLAPYFHSPCFESYLFFMKIYFWGVTTEWGKGIIYIITRQSWCCQALPKYLEKLISEWLFNYLTTNDFPGIEPFGFAPEHFLLSRLEVTCETAELVLSSKGHCIQVTIIDSTMGFH